MKTVTDPADPNRCQGTSGQGQCWHQAVSGAEYCETCGGRNTEEADKTRLYLLTEARYRHRLAQLSEHEEVKSLREEIALARMLIERRFNLIRNDSDLLAACGPINTMLLTLERLVKSAHSIETNLGALLAKPTVLRLGQQLCEIVVEELEGIDRYEEIVDRITERVVGLIKTANNSADVK